MPIGHLITLLVPDFFGEPIRGGYWSMEGYDEITYYVGVLIFLTAVAGARVDLKVGRRRLLFFLALALGAVILQIGTGWRAVHALLSLCAGHCLDARAGSGRHDLYLCGHHGGGTGVE